MSHAVSAHQIAHGVHMNASDDDLLRTLEALSAPANARQAQWQALCARVAEQHAPMLRDCRDGNDAPIVECIAGLLQDQFDEADDQAQFFPALQLHLDGLQAELHARQVALRAARSRLSAVEADRNSSLQDLQAAQEARDVARAELESVRLDASGLPKDVARRVRQERARPALWREIDAYAAVPPDLCISQQRFAGQLADRYDDWTYDSLKRMVEKRCGRLRRASR